MKKKNLGDAILEFELARLGELEREPLKPKFKGAITIINSRLDEQEKEQLEFQLNNNFYYCGCLEGRIAFALSIALLSVLILYFIELSGMDSIELLILICASLSFVACCSLAGTYVGFMRARKRLKRLIINIQSKYQYVS